MGRAKSTVVVGIDLQQVEQMLGRAAETMTAEDCALLRTVVDTLVRMTALVRERGTTIARLRRLFHLAGSEKLRDVVPPPTAGTAAAGPQADPGGTQAPCRPPEAVDRPSGTTPPPAARPKGHGRVPASAYGAAPHTPVPHPTLHAGCRCPDCQRGTLYHLKDTVPIVRIFGAAPLMAKCWDPESLRCSGCGTVFTAPLPEEARGPKYDETASSMLAILRYGSGMPLHRLDRLQANLQVPVADSTQWHLLDERVGLVLPAFQELARLAAQGEVLHNDDSYVRILEFMGRRRAALLAAGRLPDPERTGLFTTAIVSLVAAIGTIALFCTGRRHAGENLEQLLALRRPTLPPPILMSDALDRNVPASHPVVETNCLTHGRRNVVDQQDNHPAECRHLLEQLAIVYKVDKDCRLQRLSPEQRLLAHQRDSAPVMEHLHQWMTDLLEQKKVEPNCGLGKAFLYFLKRWEKFTLFLRVPGAPLDNNIAERALKKAINLRKTSLFYRSLHGASVGDVWMSLIYTAELHHENAFDYLTALQRNASAVAQRPSDWMPWNYRKTLARIHSATAPPSAA